MRQTLEENRAFVAELHALRPVNKIDTVRGCVAMADTLNHSTMRLRPTLFLVTAGTDSSSGSLNHRVMGWVRCEGTKEVEGKAKA